MQDMTDDLATRIEPLPLSYYAWRAGIERDVRVWDMTNEEVTRLVAAIRAKDKQ